MLDEAGHLRHQPVAEGEGQGEEEGEGVKVATFTVHADVRQSARWKQAAAGEGYPSVGGWLAAAADRHLQAVARSGRPVPLAWRLGSFSVRLEGGELAR